MYTDASKYGFGAKPVEKSPDSHFHLVQCMEKKSPSQEEKLSSYELEVLAVIEALKKFGFYLHGTRFCIITDSQAFQKTMDKEDLTRKIERWTTYL